MTQQCTVCEDAEVTRYKELKMCDNCYSGLPYWRSKSVGDLIKRDAQLTRLHKRANFMMGVRTNQVVTPISAAPEQQASG